MIPRRLPPILSLALLSMAVQAQNAAVFQQNGNVLSMSNGSVQVQYNLGAGTADFYWQNAKKLSAFYSGVTLSTGTFQSTGYGSRNWTLLNANEVVVTSTGAGLPVMKQYFTLSQTNSFLTSVEMDGSSALSSNWMAPIIMTGTGGGDIGSYSDDRALFVPFDNDHFISYNANSINTTGTSFEVSAFYDNTSRNGLIAGSVTHDTWKTGIYYSGSNNLLNTLEVYGGATSATVTWDTVPHGAISGTAISSPTMFIEFNPDWRTGMEDFADANAAIVPMMTWGSGVPFGWNSWGVIKSSLTYNDAITVSNFIASNLQPNGFSNNGTVYVNLDSYWNNLSNSQLQSFTANCHANGQKAGVYWGPFVYWGNASQAASSYVPPNNIYTYSDIILKDGSGNYLSNDGAYALDPTHPGTKAMIDYYASYYLGLGFDYIKLDFLSHGSLEGVHYDPTITTGIQAFNQGMQRIVNDLDGKVFMGESISPLFPYQYGNSRRIACDAFYSISDTEYTMNSVTYGWWMSNRIHQYNDPDQLVFTGGNSNENQSRLLSGAVTGLFIDGDDLTTGTGQALAQQCLTNAAINNMARVGVTFTPVEGNTGTAASNILVRQDGSLWRVAVFNYSSSSTTTAVSFARAGIPSGSYIATDLWNGTSVPVSGTMSVALNGKQSKLFTLSPVTSTTGIYRVVNQASGQTLEVQGASLLAGAPVDQWTFTGGANQYWQFNPNGDGSFTIINQNSGMALEDPNFSTANDTLLDQLGVTGSSNQHWTTSQKPNGSCLITNVFSGKTLDDPASSGTIGKIQDQWSIDGGANQNWFVTLADLPPTISVIANQTIYCNSSAGPLAFTIGGTMMPASSLVVTATSSNTALVPVSDIVLGGSGANQTVTVTPAANLSGTTTITLTVNDGLLTGSTPFNLVVLPSGVQGWRMQYFGSENNSGNGADMANPAGDGIANIIKYALGMNPNVNSVAGLPVVSAGQSSLQIQFNRNVNATDINYYIEASDDMATWTTMATWAAGGSSWTQNGVTVTDNNGAVTGVDNTPFGSAPHRFLRLRVSGP